MKAYGQHEYCGRNSVDDERPDQGDCQKLGHPFANRSKGMTRRLQRKTARNKALREIRKEINNFQ